MIRKDVIDMSNIGKQIMLRRKELGMTQEELAKLMGYKSKSTINKIELGVNDIVQSKVAKFAEILKTTPSYLMGWDQEEIDTLYEIQQEQNEYFDKLENELKTFFEEFSELQLTKEELKEVFDYAKYIKSKRS